MVKKREFDHEKQYEKDSRLKTISLPNTDDVKRFTDSQRDSIVESDTRGSRILSILIFILFIFLIYKIFTFVFNFSPLLGSLLLAIFSFFITRRGLSKTVLKQKEKEYYSVF